jgi:hypothetical protein
MILQGGISRDVMKGLTVDQNGDFENSPSPFCVIETIPASRLQTVFAITHSDLSFPHSEFSSIAVSEMLTSNREIRLLPRKTFVIED